MAPSLVDCCIGPVTGDKVLAKRKERIKKGWPNDQPNPNTNFNMKIPFGIITL